MGYISTMIEININDLIACIYAIQDQHPEVAEDILNEYLNNYKEEIDESK